jgi:RND family efflux transporter MFP subunit
MSQPQDDQASPSQGGGSARIGMLSLAIRIALPLILLGVGISGFLILSREEEPAERQRGKPKPSEVRVLELKRQDYQIAVRTHGEVRAHSEVGLTAQVGGRIHKVHAAFEEGAFFKQGEVLLELDPVDFELAVVNAETQLAQARLTLAQETSRARQAELGWQDLGYEEKASDLVLRVPHLELAELQVKLAEERSAAAKRDLERSTIRAPFDGRVLTRNVGVGQTIGQSTPLGMVFATDYSEVRLPVATRHLHDLSLPEDVSDQPLTIQLGDGLEEESEVRWTARILRTEGALDTDTLELFAIARIEDPFGLASEKVPLRIGQPVFTDIPGRKLEGVFVIPREAAANLSRIRLADPEELTLQSATIEPIWSDEKQLVFDDPEIEDGTLLILSRLIHAPDGGKVEIMEDELPLLTGDAATASTTPANKPSSATQ